MSGSLYLWESNTILNANNYNCIICWLTKQESPVLSKTHDKSHVESFTNCPDRIHYYFKMTESDTISVKINIMDGENFITACHLSDTVEMLKRRIESVSSIPFNYQRLIFRGRVLRNDQTLQECNIENNCVVFVVKQSVHFCKGNCNW